MAVISILAWVIALEVVGLCALPLAVRVFRRLDDRGYGLTKPLGLMLVGYACWLLGSLGLLNATQPTVLVLVALLALGLWVWNGREAVAVLRGQRGLVLASEAVFLAVFGLAVVVRAYGAAINGQEKFMDMAIYHAFVRSDQLPAEDPWLAGYGMAYYYLGYFLWALVAKAVEVPPAVGYNLALAGTLGLTAAGLFGLGYTLVRGQLRPQTPSPNPLPPQGAGAMAEPALAEPAPPFLRRASGLPAEPALAEPAPPFLGREGGLGGLGLLAALLAVIGVVATLVMGNLQLAVELAARLGHGSAEFWHSIGVKTVPPPGPVLFPNDVQWFNAARVIPNVPPDGITEFPWFSLILGDLHPHFVALPYELLAVGLALAAFRNLMAGAEHGKLDVGVAALALGFLIPLNTWDVGTFWVIYLLAVVAALIVRGGAATARASEGARGGVSTGVVAARLPGGRALPPIAVPPLVLRAVAVLGPTFGLALLLYLPYFVGYQSQPLGLDVVRERTMLGSLVVLFGPFLVLVVAAVVRGWLDALADPEMRALLGRCWWAIGVGLVIALAPLPRINPCCGFRDPTLSLLLLLLIGLLPLVLAARRGPGAAILAPAGTLLLLCTVGLLLGTELIYLKDSFGTRMNTVFKFYYHVWLLLGLLSPLLVAYLVGGRPTPPAPLPEGKGERDAVAATTASSSSSPLPFREGGLGGVGLAVFGGLAVVVAGALMGAGMLYPVGATWTKNNAFKDAPTLDGAAWMQVARPGDAEAIRWLQQHMPGRPVIAEAFGDDYSESARVSTFSGLPTLLGWIGHELQWRGPQPLLDERKTTLEAIYRTADPSSVALLLQAQKVDYVYVGTMEVEKYGPGVRDRFEGPLESVYRGADVTIYRVPRPESVGVGLAELRP
jgi:YYY domain-containing protein